MTQFAEFYTPIRVMLGDLDPNQIFQYQDAVIDGAIRSVFLFGRGPTGYLLTGDRSTSIQIEPDIPTGNEFALISLEAALLMIGGESTESYRTRALSVYGGEGRVNSLLGKIRSEIYRIMAGDGFSTYQSFVTWITSFRDFAEGIAVNEGVSTTVTVGNSPLFTDLST